MANIQKYSKWDSIHDPYNLVENILKNDEKVYKAMNPKFDFLLANNEICFINEIFIYGCFKVNHVVS